MIVKLKALEETRSFYKVELKKEGLTEMERNKYLSALKTIDRHIRGKQNFKSKLERRSKTLIKKFI